MTVREICILISFSLHYLPLLRLGFVDMCVQHIKSPKEFAKTKVSIPVKYFNPLKIATLNMCQPECITHSNKQGRQFSWQEIASG